MFIKLDDLELIKKKQDNGDVSEIRSVHDVRVSGRRRIVELPIPGAQRNAFQDMGRDPLTIAFDGRMVGKEAEGTIDLLEEKFEKNEALAFESDLASLKNVLEVVIIAFDARFLGGIANGIDYSLMLREHKPEPKGGEGKGGGKEGDEQSSKKSGKKDAEKKMKEAKDDGSKTGASGGDNESGNGQRKPEVEPSTESREGEDASRKPPPPPSPEGGGRSEGQSEVNATEKDRGDKKEPQVKEDEKVPNGKGTRGMSRSSEGEKQ